jgi:hypothetical protein
MQKTACFNCLGRVRFLATSSDVLLVALAFSPILVPTNALAQVAN